MDYSICDFAHAHHFQQLHRENIAPASISVVYGILLKDPAIIFNGLLPIMVVITVGCILGFIWQILRMGIDKTNKKHALNNANISQPSR
ncbi:MAG: hypothetical protein U1E91_00630 [Moraxella sp.]